jgi:hypothetical protein
MATASTSPSPIPTARPGMLVESYGYGWYVTLIWIPLYNVFNARAARKA